MAGRLNQRTVAALEAGEKDLFVWDGETKGFGLKVTPAGAKVFVVQGRVSGRPRRYTIGRLGSPWTIDSARKEAREILGLMHKGIDPVEEKRKARQDLSVAELSDTYFAEGCETKKASTLAIERGLAERHVKPLLGRRMVKSLTRADLDRFLADVGAGKTAADIRTKPRGRAIVSGGKGTANRTVDLLAAMLSFAVARGLRPDNPARGVRKYKLQPRQRFLSPKELADLGTALTQAEAAGENAFAIAAIRLLMLTGCRKNEILTLRWDWVDVERSLLSLPDSKTGAKAVLLGAPALELLAGLPRVDGNPHVFPSPTGDGHFVGLQKVWAKVRARAGLKDVRLHDLRHSFASVGASAGDSLYIVGKLLGHTQSRTTQRYAHLADDPMKAAADRISSQIAAAMRGSSADVSDISRRKRSKT